MDEEFMNIQAINMVNTHSDMIKKACEKSLENVLIAYNKKKPVDNRRVRSALLALILTGFLFVSGGKSDSYKQDVNAQIIRYQIMMDTAGDVDTRIKTNHGYNYDKNEYYFDFQPGNLVKDIVQASKESDISVRCAIIAAYKIINESYVNEQYTNQVFGMVFASLIDNEEILNNNTYDFSYLTQGSVEGFLGALGYKDWHEYQMKERANIEKLMALQNNASNEIRSENGKRK